MQRYDEMKAYVGFDAGDEALLAAFWPDVAPHADEIVDRFYDAILAAPAARAVLVDDAQVTRLKITLRAWLRELISGPWDAAYYERRQRIGRVHVRVKLPPRFMFTSMSVVRNALLRIAMRRDGAEVEALVSAVEKVTTLDLAIMTGTFIEGREEMQLSSLQDLIVSHMPVTVLLIDHAGVVTAATRTGTRLFGERGIVGDTWRNALPPALVEASHLDEHLAQALQTRREVALMRVDVEIDGRPRSFRFSIVPLDHPLAAALLHVEDLTEAVETEARLRKSEALAQLGAMSAAVAHELRNPLAGISGAIQVIARSMANDDRRRPIMEKVEQQIHRLNALVTDLLAFARPDPARMKAVSLAEVARKVKDELATEFPDLVVKVEGDGEIWGDPNLVEHVLLNLGQNSAQALEGKGTVLFRVVGTDVVIADDGPGIPPENRALVFKPFFTTRVRGTGLGLAISHKAATAMGGDLVLLDKGPLKGAAFALKLHAPTEADKAQPS